MTQSEMSQNVIVVEGRGSIEVSPDMAVLQVNLVADADSAGDALSIVSERATSVMSAIRANDLVDEDLKTTALNVFPRMDQSGLRIHHYQASYGLRVRVLDIDRAPRLIESASAAAGDALRLGGFEMTVSNTESARTEASVLAVADARRRAARLAEAASVRLGRILSITEGQVFADRRPRVLMATAASAAPHPPMPPMEAGSEEIGVQVTVTFEIADSARTQNDR